MSDTEFESDSSGNFELSISDMMSALCFIFVLVCVVLVFQLKRMSENLEEVSSRYVNMQEELYKDLSNEFADDFEKWNAEIDRENLSIRFKDPTVLFFGYSAELRDGYKNILDDFFPRLVKIISDSKYKDAMEEIRIEGHTAEVARVDTDIDYRDGMKLSQERTREVLYYCLGTNYGEENEWIRSRIIAIGYSKSKPIEIDGKIDWEASRRVEFRIKTNSEKAIRDFLSRAE